MSVKVRDGLCYSPLPPPTKKNPQTTCRGLSQRLPKQLPFPQCRQQTPAEGEQDMRAVLNLWLVNNACAVSTRAERLIRSPAVSDFVSLGNQCPTWQPQQPPPLITSKNKPSRRHFCIPFQLFPFFFWSRPLNFHPTALDPPRPSLLTPSGSSLF